MSFSLLNEVFQENKWNVCPQTGSDDYLFAGYQVIFHRCGTAQYREEKMTAIAVSSYGGSNLRKRNIYSAAPLPACLLQNNADEFLHLRHVAILFYNKCLLPRQNLRAMAHHALLYGDPYSKIFL